MVLEGLLATILIAIFGLVIGIVVGTIVALVKVTPKYNIFARIMDGIVTAYVGFFRGTPMVVQLLLGYYVLLPALGIVVDATVVAIIIFGLTQHHAHIDEHVEQEYA